MAILSLMGLAVLLPRVAWGAEEPSVNPYEEYGRRINAAQQVAPLTDSAFGDQVSLYNGATTFRAEDVSLPGNSALVVAVSRELQIEDQRKIPEGGGALHGFADWSLDVPYVWGTFTAQNGWTLAPSGATNRCSDNVNDPYMRLPYGSGGSVLAFAGDIWGGDLLHVPGSGNQQMLANTEAESPAYPGRNDYKWVTTGNWKLKCIASVSNLAGEGFVALSPSGVSYTFNYAVTVPTSQLEWQYQPSPGSFVKVKTDRVNVYLLATHVEDRFGNWVDYHYSGNHLTSITSSDSRSITLNWSGDRVTSVTSSLGTWSYEYGTSSWTNKAGVTITTPYLTKVTRPDGSQWRYTIDAGSRITNKEDFPYDDVWPPNHCQIMPLPNSGSFKYTIGAPSGAGATYWFTYSRHRRTYVPKGCLNNSDPNLHYPLNATDYFDNFYLTQKQISGPGLVTATWTYSYHDDPSPYGIGGYFRASSPWIDIASSQPYEPPGTCDSCPVGKVVTVAGPVETTKYTYGTQYARNEGQLLRKELADSSGNILESIDYTYVSDAQAPGQPFPDIAGHDLRPNYQDPMGNRNRPVSKTVIGRDGASFTTAVDGFDAYARVTRQTESSSLGFSRVNQTSYYDNTSLWVLGQVAQSTIAGIVAAETTFNTARALPLNGYRFGKLVSTKAWNADGTLHGITDGNGHATTFSNWYRGLPRTVTWADGKTEMATVNSAGWITAVTDEDGNVTSYGYDAMGRLASIGYPAGDDVAWNPTLLSFAPMTSSVYGIPAGNWKQTIHTGNGYTVTYFDAFWRPLVTERYDSSDRPTTLSQIVQRYDAGGRTIFASYPANNITSYATSNTGTHTSYDTLNRVTQTRQDSDLGLLPTTTGYLPGFQIRVTDPRGNVSVTSYQAFGEPDTSQPVTIAMPEGVTTTILRDAFGKPLSVTRSGNYGGSPMSLTRSFVYDANQLLCKRIEPETGATLFSYDGAGNLAWSASGTTLTGGVCDRGSVMAGQKITRAYDARNRLTSIYYPDGISNTSYVYASDGALVSATNNNGSSMVQTTYSYNRRRLLTGEVLNVPGATNFGVIHAYDVNGHPATLTYPDGRVIGFAPNALGQSTQAGGYATGATYYPNGAIKQFNYGDGSIHTLTQNLRQLPERSRDTYLGNAVMDNRYDYDGNGNVAAITDGLPGNVGDVDMSYDALDRLIAATSPAFAGSHQAIFAYDPLDNLRSAAPGDGNQYTYYYDAANRLATLAGTQMIDFGYDARGNVIARNSQSYTFDMANRLRAANGLESYLYDAAGRRTRKTGVGNGISTYYAYDRSGSLLYQWEPATMKSSDYVYLGGGLVAKVTQSLSVTKGNIDGVATDTSGKPYVKGWACSTGINQSIAVELFAGPSGGGGSRVGFYTANQPSEPAVANACQASGTAYRFAITLTDTIRSQYPGASIYMYADSPVGNANNELSGSGSYTIPPMPAPPPTPASISVPASSSTGSVTVSWTSSPNTDSYTLQQQFNGGSWTQAYAGSATSKAVSGLGDGSYVYRVQACNDYGCSGWRTSGALTVALIPPTPASINVPASSSTGSITTSWAASSYATSYTLQQQINSGSWTQVYSGSATSKAFSGLGNGSYVYRVQACNGNGCSSWRSSGTLTVALIPASPASITVPASSYNASFGVSWSGSANASNYVLEQSLNGGGWGVVWNGNATGTTVTVDASGTYRFQVSACGAGGCSAFRTSGNVAVTLPPASAPSLSGPSSSTSGTFMLSWTAVAGATRYQLNQRLNGGSATVAYNAGGGSWTSGSLGNGSYAYQVYACNAAGCSGASSQVTVTVLHPPAAPASVTAPSSAKPGVAFGVSWSASATASRYELRQTLTDTGAVSTPYSGTATSKVITLWNPPDGIFQYAARACNSAGCSGWKNAPNVTWLKSAINPRLVEPASGSSQ